MITTIKEEVSYAKSYLEIMAMRKRIRYTIEMPKEIGELPIIPLILEPLIENAIEHGLEGCESAKQIEIDWTKNGAVSFAISDDGEGMTKEHGRCAVQDTVSNCCRTSLSTTSAYYPR